MVASVQHMQRPKACAPSEEFQGHTSCCKAEGGWRNRKASCVVPGPRGRGACRGGCGRGLGRLVYLSSEEEANIIAPDVNKHVDTGADAMQEQVMRVQAHPYVQCARAAAAATSEQLPLVAQCMQ
jgi:hypothetical protein